MLKLEDKVKILKRHQVYCYQVCLCLLKNTKSAEQAACQALLDVAHYSDFFVNNPLRQKAMIRKAAIIVSEKMKRNIQAC